jgi:U6 snRNA-associated Sm-like protein LSm8
VNVLTNDGRCIVGVLRGCDQTNNLVLEDCHERMFSPQARGAHRGKCWFRLGCLWLVLCNSFCQHKTARNADTHVSPCPCQSGVEQVPLGLYFVRGDNVAIVGEVDEDLDANTDLSALRAQPLRPIRH